MLRTALISLGLMLFLTSCAETRYLTRTERVLVKVPAEYLVDTQIPGPPRLIEECPAYVEVLKDTIGECNDDKADARDHNAKAEAGE